MQSTEIDALRKSARRAAVKAGAPDSWADDIADEAVARYFLTAEEIEKPTPWVRRVARNLAIDAHRREPSQGWGDMPLSAPAPGQRPYPPYFQEPSPSLVVRQRGQVEEVLEVLTPIEQKLLVGAAAGLSAQELADRYGYTVASVRTKISAARKKIRDAFPNRTNFDA
jgi:DNA-directed RNA polymerase specialized sigma24 family protein